MKKFTFPLEKTAPMRLLGKIMTGLLPGQILVVSLILIAAYFLGKMNFSLISLMIFFGLFVPFGIFIHFRLVVKGRRLMKANCTVEIDSESNLLKYQSGFPNIMDTKVHQVKLSEDNRNLTVKGSEVSGFQIWLGKGKGPEAIRFGSWIDLEDARISAQELAKTIGGDLEIAVNSS